MAHCIGICPSELKKARNGDCVAHLDILGVEFYSITLSGAEKAIEWMLSRNDGVTRVVVTANPIMVINARKDAEFMEILNGADLITPDGVGIIWASRRLGKALPGRVTGVDIVQNLFSGETPLRVFLLGGKPNTAEAAKDAIKLRYPTVEVVGTQHGFYDTPQENRVVAAINKCAPDVLLVGMGSPKQEKFIWRNRSHLGAKVAIGVGGVFDVLSGSVPRAPEIFQRLGLEWLYRLAREPGRLKADLALLDFAIRVQASAFRRGNKVDKGDEDHDGDIGTIQGS